MDASLNNLALVLLPAIIAIWLPLLLVAYYFLRLELRRRALSARIIELHLEPDYLRMYDFAKWTDQCGPQVKDKDPVKIREAFGKAFNNQFGGGNRIFNYALPFLLTLMSSVLFALIVYAALAAPTTDAPYFKNGILPLAIGGALLYISPLYISRYSSLALTPHELLGLLVRTWIAVLVGVLAGSMAPDVIKAATAFASGLVPVGALEWLRDRIGQGDKAETDETRRIKKLLEVVQLDEDLVDQLRNIGIRSVLELAYENPLRIFVETDLNLVVAIDLVDQANLWLYVPDDQVRADLNRYGIRTAIDIMTQMHGTFKAPCVTDEAGFLTAESPLPEFLTEPFTNIAKSMRLESISTLRNTMQMMIDNPQLEYVRQLWDMVNKDVDQSTNPCERH